VRVLFDPADPSNARIDSFMQLWFTPLLLAGMGSVFAGIGAWATVTLARQPGIGRGGPKSEPDRSQPANSEPAKLPPAAKSFAQDSARRTSVIERQNRD
jgi:hypothetical protein